MGDIPGFWHLKEQNSESFAVEFIVGQFNTYAIEILVQFKIWTIPLPSQILLGSSSSLDHLLQIAAFAVSCLSLLALFSDLT